jgi:predicted secreted protein
MPTEYTERTRFITAPVGREFVIALEEHPTGHEWRAEFDPSVLALVDAGFSPLGPGVGAGGTRRFRFRAIAARDTAIELRYQRPWEANPARQLVVQVRIAG